MTKFEIGGLVALVVAVIGGAVAFGNLQGRVASMEKMLNPHRSPIPHFESQIL